MIVIHPPFQVTRKHWTNRREEPKVLMNHVSFKWIGAGGEAFLFIFVTSNRGGKWTEAEAIRES